MLQRALMKLPIAFIPVILLGLVTVAHSDTLLVDNFNGQAIDTTKWQALAPLSDSQINESGGNANFTQRGILISNDLFPEAIQIDGRFAFTGGSYDQFQIALRTDGNILFPLL